MIAITKLVRSPKFSSSIALEKQTLITNEWEEMIISKEKIDAHSQNVHLMVVTCYEHKGLTQCTWRRRLSTMHAIHPWSIVAWIFVSHFLVLAKFCLVLKFSIMFCRVFPNFKVYQDVELCINEIQGIVGLLCSFIGFLLFLKCVFMLCNVLL